MRTDGISPSSCDPAEPTPNPEWVAQVYPLPPRPLSIDAAAQHRERVRLTELEAIRAVQRGTLNQRSIAPPLNSTPRRARWMLLRHALAAMVAAATIAALIETFRGGA